MNCIFCAIARGDVPTEILDRTKRAVAFRDLHPQAPTHVLVVPIAHATDLGDFVARTAPEDVQDLFALAARVGRAGSPAGYRVVTNEGALAGQSVSHLHLHVLGGRALLWPPG